MIGASIFLLSDGARKASGQRILIFRRRSDPHRTGNLYRISLAFGPIRSVSKPAKGKYYLQRRHYESRPPNHAR